MAIRTLLTHTSGQWIAGYYYLSCQPDDPQSVGKAVTYAKRYAHVAMLNMVADDDTDAEDVKGDGKVIDVMPANQRDELTKIKDNLKAKFAEAQSVI